MTLTSGLVAPQRAQWRYLSAGSIRVVGGRQDDSDMTRQAAGAVCLSAVKLSTTTATVLAVDADAELYCVVTPTDRPAQRAARCKCLDDCNIN